MIHATARSDLRREISSANRPAAPLTHTRGMAGARRSVAVGRALLARMDGLGALARVRSVDVEACGRACRAEMAVSDANVPELGGHFPGRGVVPAVVLLEAMFQAAAALTIGDAQDSRRMDIRSVGRASFRRAVGPDDGRVLLRVERTGDDRFEGRAWVRGDEVVASASFDAVVHAG